jgi:starch synthase (maltosyl-transferring)
VAISADVLTDGHEPLRVVARWREPDAKAPVEIPLENDLNDSWHGEYTPKALGRHTFTIAGWSDPFDWWRHRASTFSSETSLEEVDVELAEAAVMVKERLGRAKGDDRAVLDAVLERLNGGGTYAERLNAALDGDLHEVMIRLHDKKSEEVFRPHVEVIVDRRRARLGAWYEMFPRSEGGFRAAEARLDSIAAMGFDVLYLPPIHPIGATGRKGKGNTLTPAEDDVGSPWAIGSRLGGHTAVDPTLGTIEDFDHFVAAAKERGLEVALDFAIQCSPDHPWVREHPEFFTHRADGSIRYAENPPKKYQDIYPVNWDGPHVAEMSELLKEVVLFWVSHGIRIFRVDNPHTKPIPFWEWLIREVQREYPDTVFLAEAFTRPKVMRALAKVGFSQSYTYFTWRNTKEELEEYLTELAADGSAAFMRTNFFANTPDILHAYLQHGGPAAFAVRLVLAATLSPSYGIYAGFELYENVPQRQGSEEYFASEKYELRPRRWDVPGSLAPLISRVNQIRRSVTAFDRIDNIEFCTVDNDALIAYRKDDVLVVVNLDPLNVREGMLRLPGAPADYEVVDLLSGFRYRWAGEWNYVRLDPWAGQPAHIFRLS